MWFHNWYCEKGVRHFDCIIWKKNVLTCVPGIIVGYSSYDGLWADFWQWYGVWSACIMWLPEQIFNCIYNLYYCMWCMIYYDNMIYRMAYMLLCVILCMVLCPCMEYICLYLFVYHGHFYSGIVFDIYM